MDSSLVRLPFLDAQGRAVPATYHYKIPEVPIPLVIEVENAVRPDIEQLDSDYPAFQEKPEDDDGVRWAKILLPRGPEDVIPDEEFI
jgi:hypothetical protein